MPGVAVHELDVVVDRVTKPQIRLLLRRKDQILRRTSVPARRLRDDREVRVTLSFSYLLQLSIRIAQRPIYCAGEIPEHVNVRPYGVGDDALDKKGKTVVRAVERAQRLEYFHCFEIFVSIKVLFELCAQ